MSIYKTSPRAEFYSYRFMHRKKIYTGCCYGCTTVKAAQEFESKIKSGLTRAESARSMEELYLQFRDDLLEANPVPIEGAFEKAMMKPRRRTPGARRMQNKANYWTDFVFFLHRRYPDVRTLQRVTPAIAENYIGLIRKYGLFKNHFLKQNESKLANATLNESHAVLIQVFDALRNETHMEKNPFKEIEKLPMQSTSHEAYTLTELQLIFEKADDLMRPLFMIGLFSGLRLGDICTLRKDEIFFDRHFIVRKQRKTGYTANIPMHPYLENYLRSIYTTNDGNDYLLPEHAEHYLRSPSWITNRVNAFLTDELKIQTTKNIIGRKKAVNVKGIHSLRHTFCSVAGVCGIPEPVVRSIVGHMTPEMTRLYSQHVEEQDKLRYIELFGNRVGGVLGGMENISLMPAEQDHRKKEILSKLSGCTTAQLDRILSMLNDTPSSL